MQFPKRKSLFDSHYFATLKSCAKNPWVLKHKYRSGSTVLFKRSNATSILQETRTSKTSRAAIPALRCHKTKIVMLTIWIGAMSKFFCLRRFLHPQYPVLEPWDSDGPNMLLFIFKIWTIIVKIGVIHKFITFSFKRHRMSQMSINEQD